MKTDLEIQIEKWWDNLNDSQINWLETKFYEKDIDGINTLKKVVFCYNSLNKKDLLELSNIMTF